MEKMKRNWKPYKIVDPTTSWRTVKLLPCQKLILKLKSPFAFHLGVKDPNLSFQVNLISDFLILEKYVCSEKGTTYEYVPKYDLNGWLEFGHVLLGNIIIEVPEINFKSTIVIIQESKQNPNIINVIYPDNIAVKFQPHQTIRVICQDSGWKFNVKPLKDFSFDYKSHGFLSENAKFKRIVNPKISPLFKPSVMSELLFPPPQVEQFFDFALDKEQHKKLMNTSNDVYDVSNVEFTKNIGDEVHKLSFKALLDVKAKDKYKMTEKQQDLTVRKEIFEKNIIRNPVAAEIVDFFPGREEIIIELASPVCFHEDASCTDNWVFSCTEGLILEELDSFVHWERRIQKFKIRIKYLKNVELTETKCLGSVTFSYKEDSRKIIFYYNPPSKEESHKTDNFYDYSSYGCAPCGGGNRYKTSSSDIKICEVSFQEIDSDLMEDVVKTDFKKKQNTQIANVPKQDTTLTNSTSDITLGLDDGKFVIVANPQDHQIIDIEYDDILVVRFHRPEKYNLGECDENWVIQSYLAIDYVKSLEKEGNKYVEIKIIPSQNRPFCFQGESLTLKASKGSITVYVRVIKKKTKFSELIPQGNSHYSKDGKINLEKWSHRDSVIISSSDRVMISEPISSWTDQWSCEIRQLGIGKDILEDKSLSDIINKIDKDNFWIGKTSPIRISGRWFIKSMQTEQPYVNQVLNVISKHYKKDVLHIAKLIFKNFKHPDNEESITSFGIISKEYKIQKELNIFLTLPKPEIEINDPIDGMNVKVKKNDSVVFKLKPIYVNSYMFAWVVKSTGYNFKCNMKYVDGSNVFKFESLECGKSQIVFNCQQVTRTINLEVS